MLCRQGISYEEANCSLPRPAPPPDGVLMAAAAKDVVDQVRPSLGGLLACHALTVALHGDPDACRDVISILRSDERTAETGVAYRREPAQLSRLVAHHQDIGAVMVVWGGGEATALVRLVDQVQRDKTDPLLPVLVRLASPLPASARARLKALGLYGQAVRDGLALEHLVDDLLDAMVAVREKQALVELSEFVDGAASVDSVRQLADESLAFLHRRGIGEGGGLFCLLRPTSQPTWVAVAGTGRFGGIDCMPVAELPPPLDDEVGRGLTSGESSAGLLVLPLDTPEGHRACLCLAQREPLLPWQRLVRQMFSKRLAVALDDVLLRRRIERMHQATIATLATISEYKDRDTGDHVSRVARLTTAVAHVLAGWAGAGGVNEAMLRHIGQASVLHDIGKVGIPDRILLKAGPLDADERLLIEQHTLIGHEILLKTALISDSPDLIRLAADVARSHHERFDGTGYPDGLAGHAIPLAARIVAVVDVYDALTGIRPYKAAWTEDQAIDFICQQAGSQFDPKVVEAFLAALDGRRDGAPAQWTESFSVENDAIDQDHRKLFDILNQLWSAREVGNRQIIEMALDDLMHYSLVHFGREERHMESIGYPGAASHRQSHAAFCRRIEAFRWEYHYGVRTDVHAELVSYLSWWLLSHIAQEDRSYHLHGRRVAPQTCLPISSMQ